MMKSKFYSMCQWLAVMALMLCPLPIRACANEIADKAASISAPTSASTGSQEAAAPGNQSPAPANLPRDASKRAGDTPAISPDDYVIGPLDLLAINVWHEPELSRTVPVRPDGKISLPLVGEMNASRLTPKMLQTRIAEELELYMKRPKVTVIVQEANSHRFNIIGKVQHPGSYLLTNSMSVLDGLAASGGFRDFAKVKKIYLLRRLPDGTRKRIPFDYDKAIKGGNQYPDVQLQPGDTIVVP